MCIRIVSNRGARRLSIRKGFIQSPSQEPTTPIYITVLAPFAYAPRGGRDELGKGELGGADLLEELLPVPAVEGREPRQHFVEEGAYCVVVYVFVDWLSGGRYTCAIPSIDRPHRSARAWRPTHTLNKSTQNTKRAHRGSTSRPRARGPGGSGFRAPGTRASRRRSAPPRCYR